MRIRATLKDRLRQLIRPTVHGDSHPRVGQLQVYAVVLDHFVVIVVIRLDAVRRPPATSAAIRGSAIVIVDIVVVIIVGILHYIVVVIQDVVQVMVQIGTPVIVVDGVIKVRAASIPDHVLDLRGRR